MIIQNKTLLTTAAVSFLAMASPAIADPHNHEGHDHGGNHMHRMAFEHPLLTESPLPDRKVRLNYSYTNKPGEDGEDGKYISELKAITEYAFTESFSIEAALPYAFKNPKGNEADQDGFGDAKIGFKYANYSFEEHGWLVGGGLEAELPTGDDTKEIGSNNELTIEPFLSAGFIHNQFQAVGIAALAFPTNQHTDNETDYKAEWNLSFLYQISPNLNVMAEFAGEHVTGGEEDGLDAITLQPGITYKLPQNNNFMIGAGVNLPISDDREIHAAPMVSLFYHF